MKRTLFIVSALLIAIFPAATVLAAGCSAMASNTIGVEGNVLNYRLSSPLVTIDPNAPVGTILWTRNINSSGTKWICTSTAQRQYRSTMSGAFSTVVGSNSRGNIYATGVEGLGIQVSDLYQPNKGVGVLAYPTALETLSFTSSGYTRIDFIKVGPIGTGDLTNGQIATFTMDGVNVMTLSMLGSRLKNKSCTIDGSYNRTIPLGRFKTTEINPTSDKVKFTLSLKCAADAVPVYIQFDPLTGSSGDGLLKIDTTVPRPASGVAIEITDENTSLPIKFGVETKYHMNQETSVAIPLIAKYKKTGSVITPGQANAGMTITINER